MNCRGAPQPIENIRPNQTGQLNRQTGLTLVELMVSLTLGLLLLAVIGTIYLGSSQTYRAQEANARILENGLYALEVIGHSLRRGGYVDITITNSALNAIDQKVAFGGTAINGVDDTCLPSVGTANTDIVTVQYDGVTGEQDCEAGNIAAGEFVQNTFFLQDDTTQTPPVPGLRCKAIHNAAAFAPPTACPSAGSGSALVDNVEDMQIIYGIDVTGDQSADSYTATPGDWGQVIEARVCLLVRSENLGVATAQRYQNCPGALGIVTGTAAFTSATDTRLRRIFVSSFNLRNLIKALP